MASDRSRALRAAVRRALRAGLVCAPAVFAPAVHAQGTTANDAVRAAAEAAQAAAEAAQAAAEAARVAAEAARAAVEASRGLTPAQQRTAEAMSQSNPFIAEAMAEVAYRREHGEPERRPRAAQTPPIASKDVDTPRSASAALRVYSREELAASGQTLLSEFLRDLAQNTNGSYRQTTGGVDQSQSFVSLRGLGSDGTLVLLDGERIAGSPSRQAGAATDLNVLPLAAVERVEVLSDVASARYGNSAVGGVINIVTQVDDGFVLSGGVSRPSREGGDEQRFSASGAVTSAMGRLQFSLDHAAQDIVINGDRDYSALGLSSFGFPGSFFANGPNGESLGTFPDPRCPAGDGSGQPTGEGPYPDSVVLGSRCRYNFLGVGSTEASHERTSALLKFDTPVSDTVDAYARALITSSSASGRNSATPTVGGSPFLPTISAANPNNPTNPANQTNANGDDLTPFHFLGDQPGPYDLSVFYRNVPGGFRDRVVDDTLLDIVAGVRATDDALGGIALDLVAQRSEHSNRHEIRGLVQRDRLQSAIDFGAFDVFGVNGPTDANALGFGYTGIGKDALTLSRFRAELALDNLSLGAVSLPLTVGVSHTREDYARDFDPLLNQPRTSLGTNPVFDVSGTRDTTSVFGGLGLSFGRAVTVGYHVRATEIDRHGRAPAQELSLNVQPRPGVTFFASYNDGFVAPTFFDLDSPRFEGFNSAVDVTRCAAEIPGAINPDGSVNANAIPPGTPPNSPCFSTQYRTLTGGNPELGVADVSSWQAGITLGASDRASMTLAAYDITIDNQITERTLQDILADEFVNGSSALVTRNSLGQITRVQVVPDNSGQTRTRGATLDATVGAYRRGSGPGARLNATYIDQLSASDVPAPNLRANLDVLWRFADFATLNVNGNYIGEAEIGGGSAALEAWLTWDAGITFNLPWSGTLMVGARNLFDEDPPLSATFGNVPYTNVLHNPYGVVPYVNYEQSF